MANPKKKHTRMRTSIRRASNWRMETPNISPCPQCRVRRPSHVVCPSCGFYAGELIMPPRVKKPKKGEGDSTGK